MIERTALTLTAILMLGTPGELFAQASPEQRQQLADGLADLAEQLLSAQESNLQTVDVDIFAKAVDWILRHDEFYQPRYADDAIHVLQQGRDRLKALADGNPNWGRTPGRSVLGYRSRVDGSVQPYALTLPGGFESDSANRWPLYLVLHGRANTMNEVRFIANHEGKPPSPEQTWIQLDVFGRGNNAYRWAGETDVFEALQDVIRRYRIDEQRITLWGFSMGGAGAWHLGLHHPSRWSSVGAGAGFVDFYAYQNQTERLPDYQHRALRIYDAQDYALNLSTVPFITYGGETDKQLIASLTMKRAALDLDVPLALRIGPEMGHQFDENRRAEFMAFLKTHNDSGRRRFPGRREFRFVTHTLKYNRCEWLEIQAQEIPYERTIVTSRMDESGHVRLTTENATALSVARRVADQIRIDTSDPFNLISAAEGNLPDVYFVKTGDDWSLLDYDQSLDFEDNVEIDKRHDLQGPIDDAFMERFLCVSGSGRPGSSALHSYSGWAQQRFAQEFDKWMRGRVPLVRDTELTAEQIRDQHLILFGDPGSNSVLAQILDQLPVQWDRESFTFQGKTYPTQDHALVMIRPNPLNPRKYVVINTGMTMHEKDFQASNSWLFPKLGDWAILRFQQNDAGGFDESLVDAGIFDSHWE